MADAMSGYAALHEGAAWFDLSDRARIRAAGADHRSFLHNLSSNAVEHLQPGQGTSAFFLDAQGHIQADARLYVAEDSVLLDTEPESRVSLIHHLDKFIIMDDVTLEDQTGSTAELAIEGPLAEEVAGSVVPELPTTLYGHLQSDDIRIIRNTFTGQTGFWFIVPSDHKEEWAGRLEQAGAMAASVEDGRIVRVENQVARHGEDFLVANLPHESQRLDRVSFTKGCYLGQEIVERIRSRGQVNRLLVGVEIEGREPPERGAKVWFDGKQVGEVSSPVYSPRLNRVVAFALVRRQASEPGTRIEVEGLAGQVRPRS